ncbi:MAG: hypothetical protein ACI87E_003689 [Mariniblastus sp.]|jgi:hypothetical protein
MPTSINTSFDQIRRNNSTVDLALEAFVNTAIERNDSSPEPDRMQLEKTTRLAFLSSLLMGERDSDTEA